MLTISSMGLANAVAQRVCSIQPTAVSQEACLAAKSHLLDCLGLTIAGSSSDRVRRASAVDGVPDPVVILSLACSALGLDDFDEATRAHPGAMIVPALLVGAAGARRPVSGKRLATALVIGYELIAWLGAAMDARHMHPRGRHPSAVLGVPSVAVAAAWLAELDERAVAAALGIASGFSFGLTQFDEQEDLRALQTAAAASAGLRAARFAAAGFSASPQALEGAGGLLGGDTSRVLPVDGIGTIPSAVELASFKPYPHFSDLHSLVAALLSAFNGASADIGQIVVIRAFLTEEAASRLYEGPVVNVKQAKRSAAFVLAFTLRSITQGGPDIRVPFTEADVVDPHTQALSNLVEVRTTNPASHAGSAVATVEITLANGRSLTATSTGYPGDGRDRQLRWSLAEARERFALMVGSGVQRRNMVDAALRLADRLDTSNDIRDDARTLVRELAALGGGGAAK